MISLRKISKKYGEEIVISDFSLCITSGEVVGLYGTSGIGKTTLLNIISGLESSDAGEIESGFPDSPLYLFQKDTLFEWKTLQGNIELALKLRHSANTVEDCLEKVGLAGMGGKYPRQLSGGQQKRAVLAVALASQAPLILADEPLASLDESARIEMALLIRRLAEERGWTMLFVSHSAEEMALVSDRVVVMRKGGKIESIVQMPESPRSKDALKPGGIWYEAAMKIRNYNYAG